MATRSRCRPVIPVQAMQPPNAIDATDSRQARKILQKTGPSPGVCREFFERVVELAGSDPKRARSLASRWRVFKDLGDDPAYAVRARAVGERIAGHWKRAGDSFLEAASLTKNKADRVVFAIGAVDSFARSGDVALAVAQGNRLVKQLQKIGENSQAGRVHLNLGNALLFADDYKRSSQHYQAATALLEGSEFKRDWAAAELGVSGTELFGGSVTKATEHAEKAAQLFDELGDHHFADLARLNLAHCFTLHGKGDEAVTLLLELGPKVQDSPSDDVRREEFLGDAYLRLNLYEEALDAYSQAMQKSLLRHMPINLANTYHGKGHAQVALGNAAAGKRNLVRAAELYLSIGNYVWAGAAMSAAAELEKRAVAKRKSEEAIALLRKSKSTFHLAQALIRHAERFGGPRGVAEAERIIEDRGYHFLAWRIHAARARSSKGSARLSKWRAMFESMMTERLSTRSTASRAAYLRDKHSALSEYLTDLLQKARPRVDEALDVVTRSRSIALIDEMVAANPDGFSEAYLTALDELRKLIAEESSRDSTGARRVQSEAAKLSHLCRSVLETDFSPRQYTNSDRETVNVDDTAVFVDVGDNTYCLYKGNSIKLGVSEPEMQRIVRSRRIRIAIAYGGNR